MIAPESVTPLPVGTQFVFHGPYDQYADRKGQTAMVIEYITQNTDEIDYDEVGPMYTIRFVKDGLEVNAWPEEVEELGY